MKVRKSDMIEIMFEDLLSIIVSHGTKHRELEKGSYLFHQGDEVESIFVIESGSVELTRFQHNGAPLVLQRAGAGSFLAEASVYSETYHCDALIVETGQACELKRASFLDLMDTIPRLAELWATHLSKEVQTARYRSEILARKSVSERLDCWLTWKGGTMPPKGKWKSVADQIGVSTEALYRELAKRRK